MLTILPGACVRLPFLPTTKPVPAPPPVILMSPFTFRLPTTEGPATLTEPVGRILSPPVPVVRVALVEPATLMDAEPFDKDPTRTLPAPDCVNEVVAPETLRVPPEPAMP